MRPILGQSKNIGLLKAGYTCILSDAPPDPQPVYFDIDCILYPALLPRLNRMLSNLTIIV